MKRLPPIGAILWGWAYGILSVWIARPEKELSAWLCWLGFGLGIAILFWPGKGGPVFDEE